MDSKTVQRILLVGPSEGAVVKTTEDAGFAKPNRGRGPKTWTTTQLAQSFGSATAPKPMTGRTAEAALALFLARVDRVNSDDNILAKVTRVVLFGSYPRAEANRLGDVDVAVELRPKRSGSGTIARVEPPATNRNRIEAEGPAVQPDTGPGIVMTNRDVPVSEESQPFE